jgi:hypothetical protein
MRLLLEERSACLAERGARYSYLVAPEAHSVYPHWTQLGALIAVGVLATERFLVRPPDDSHAPMLLELEKGKLAAGALLPRGAVL